MRRFLCALMGHRWRRVVGVPGALWCEFCGGASDAWTEFGR